MYVCVCVYEQTRQVEAVELFQLLMYVYVCVYARIYNSRAGIHKLSCMCMYVYTRTHI